MDRLLNRVIVVLKNFALNVLKKNYVTPYTPIPLAVQLLD